MRRTAFKPKKTEKKVIAEYRKTPKKGWIPPKWIGSIPQGSHGTGKIQKKAWKVTSDYVRIQNYHTYGGVCPGCNQFKFTTWKDGQCGHFKSWGASNSYAKYFLKNLLMICANCNNNENGLIGFNMGAELLERYGEDVIDEIDEENNLRRGQKIEDMVLVGMIELLIIGMGKLPEQPDYYQKVIEQL